MFISPFARDLICAIPLAAVVAGSATRHALPPSILSHTGCIFRPPGASHKPYGSRQRRADDMGAGDSPPARRIATTSHTGTVPFQDPLAGLCCRLAGARKPPRAGLVPTAAESAECIRRVMFDFPDRNRIWKTVEEPRHLLYEKPTEISFAQTCPPIPVTELALNDGPSTVT